MNPSSATQHETAERPKAAQWSRLPGDPVKLCLNVTSPMSSTSLPSLSATAAGEWLKSPTIRHGRFSASLRSLSHTFPMHFRHVPWTLMTRTPSTSAALWCIANHSGRALIPLWT